MHTLELRTVAEAASQLRLSDRAIYDLCRRGRLSHLRLGRGRGAIRIAQRDVDAYLSECFVPGVVPEEGTLCDVHRGCDSSVDLDPDLQTNRHGN